MQQLDQLFTQAVNTKAFNSATTVVIGLLASMVIGVLVALVYKHVHRGVSYSQSYAYSIVMMTMVVTLVMLVIGGNLTKAFTLLGAFTIIRFRTAVKDPKDTVFIFAALVLGLAVGSGYYAMAATGTVIICLAALILDKFNFGTLIKKEYVLYLVVDPKKIDQEHLEPMLHTIFLDLSVININFRSESKSVQFTYNAKLAKAMTYTKAMQMLSEIEGVRSAEILASQQIVEF